MDACGEGCGWAAAVVAMLSFGSFGVAIKSETCRRLEIDPLVFQSYKTFVCFVTSFLVLGVMGYPFRFTPWGIVSAMFWVPGGVGTVAAVQLAGLAVAVAVGNSCIACVSFLWGIFFFREPIHSRSMACVGVVMMILGFIGMSYYSTRSTSSCHGNNNHSNDGGNNINDLDDDVDGYSTTTTYMDHEQQTLGAKLLITNTSSGSMAPPRPLPVSPSSNESIELIEEARPLTMGIHDFETKTNSNVKPNHTPRDDNHINSNDTDGDGTLPSAGLRHRHHQVHTLHRHSNEMVPIHPPNSTKLIALDPFSSASVSNTAVDPIIPTSIHHESKQQLELPSLSFFHVVSQSNNPHPNDILLIIGSGCGDSDWKLSRRQVGIALAVFNGSWGGSILAPMKFCPDPTITTGIGYVWSFSIGAMLVNAGMWIFRFLWLLAGTTTDTTNNDTNFRRRSLQHAYESLPPLHIAEMWKLGGFSGLLWSIGNLFSLLSVDYLGEGVGYCVVQASMLISGLWGILYFQEVKGASTITKWFLSAFLTVSGILLLSYEHHVT